MTIEREQSQTEIKAGLLYGAPSIAAYLGISHRQARYLIEKNSIPTFKLPSHSTICARKTSIDKWLVDQDKKAMENRYDQK